MTTSALITMLTVWAIVTFFMLRFLFKVIKTPQSKDNSQEKQKTIESVHRPDHLQLL